MRLVLSFRGGQALGAGGQGRGGGRGGSRPSIKHASGDVFGVNGGAEGM